MHAKKKSPHPAILTHRPCDCNLLSYDDLIRVIYISLEIGKKGSGTYKMSIKCSAEITYN